IAQADVEPLRAASPEALLDVRDLKVIHRRRDRSVSLVDGVSFSVARGEIFGLVGESGSGKSITALATIRLLAEGIGAAGRIMFEGRDLTALSEAEMRDVRGGKISMIFQEPIAALNPVFTVGSQIVAAIRAHAKVGRADAHRRAVDLLRKVGIPDPDS